jgi:glycosyltransferase involved in cell wall biosynthesis
MRILYSHRTKSADGQYVHIRELTEALSARGHDLIMCGPEDDGGAPRMLDAGDGRAGLRDRLPGALYEALEAGYSLAAYRKLAAACEARRPDLIYERYNLYYHAGVWLKRRRKLPLILEVNAPLVDERIHHGGLSLAGLARKSEASIWRAADAVLPVTNVLADHVRAAGVEEQKITIIQNGVSAEFLATPDEGNLRATYKLDGRLVLGFTGFVRDWHGVDRVLQFMARSDRSDLHFLLVGDGPARPGLEALARDLGLAQRFTCTGAVQRADIPAHVALFDIALQPAVVAYASPLKLFEYMALRRPIVAPATANIMEVLRSDDEALLFDETVEGAFERALARLVENPDLRKHLGEGARKRLERDDFTWEGNAKRVEEIAQNLLEQKNDLTA